MISANGRKISCSVSNIYRSGYIVALKSTSISKVSYEHDALSDPRYIYKT